MPLARSLVRAVRSRVSFPLRIASGGRYLATSDGAPFLIVGDSPWELPVQCTEAQMVTYLDDRFARGFNAIMFECCEALHSMQTPFWRNAYGEDPFSANDPAGTTAWQSPSAGYWGRTRFILAQARARGMLCIVHPAYWGFSGDGSNGWKPAVDAASNGNLQAYGAYLGALDLEFGNILWCLGGDNTGDSTSRAKQWNIVTGIRSVAPNALITGHPFRSDGDSWGIWGPAGDNLAGFNVNSSYALPTDIVSECATAYGRGAIPNVFLEGWYEGEHSTTTNDVAYQTVQAYLSGCCGFFFANNPLWCFGAAAGGSIGAAAAISGYLNTAGAQHMTAMAGLLRAHAWQLLVPKIDSSVVTTSLGTGTSATCPARASDGTFALIGKNNSSSITVDKTCITKATFAARWFDPANGAYTVPAEGLYHSNSGTQSFAHPGNNSTGSTAWVLVLG